MMETPAQKLGQQLQAKREQLGFSLKDVAQHTRIRRVYLESMEQGLLEELPGQAYITGFVRVYARHVGLDSNDLLALLDVPQDVETTQTPDSDSEDSSRTTAKGQDPAGKGWGAFVLGFIVVLALGGLFYFLPSFFSSEAPVETIAEDPVKAQETETSHSPDVVVVAESTAVTTTEPTIESTSAPLIESEPEPVLEAVVTPVEEKPAQDPLPNIPQAGASLRMLALAESSLIIYVDEREPHEYKLYDGLDLTWKVKKTVRVEMTEPGVAQFWLGRQELPIKTLGSFQLQPASGD